MTDNSKKYTTEERSWYLLMGEIKDGVVRRIEDGDRVKDVLVTPFGATATRIILEGSLISRTDVGKEGSSFLRITLQDITGRGKVFLDRYSGDLYDKVLSLPDKERVRVVCVVRSFEGNDGRVLSLRAKELYTVDPGQERVFPTMALLSLLPRFTALKDDKLPEGTDKMFGDLIFQLFRSLNQFLWQEKIRNLFFWIKGEGGEVDDEEVIGDLGSNEKVVLNLMKELDRGEGVRRGDLESYVKSKHLSLDNVKETLKVLLERGTIYEPVIGMYKIV